MDFKQLSDNQICVSTLKDTKNALSQLEQTLSKKENTYLKRLIKANKKKFEYLHLNHKIIVNKRPIYVFYS